MSSISHRDLAYVSVWAFPGCRKAPLIWIRAEGWELLQELPFPTIPSGQRWMKPSVFVLGCLISLISWDFLFRIQKRFALSPRLFFKTTEMISGVFKSVSQIKNIKILSIYLWNRKNTTKNRANLNNGFWNNRGEAQKCLRIRAYLQREIQRCKPW